SYAAPEVKRTIDFLRNQRLINANEIVHIHILGSEQQIKSLENVFKTDALNDINIHKISDLQFRAGLEGLSGKFADGILTWLCAKQLALQAHYGEVKEYSQYYYALGSKALKAASILLALSALLITESNLSGVIEHERSIELLAEQASEYQKTYKKRFEEYEPVFKNARSMNAAVDMADRIHLHGQTSPLDFMIELSEVLSRSGLGVVHVDKIEWKAEQYKNINDKKQIYKEKGDVTTEDPIRHVGVIHGRIAVSDKNYRGSVSQVNRIITALAQHKRVEHVEAIEMPVEVRPEKAFTDESGLNVNVTANKEKGKFALRVTMKEAVHE
ncbi:MAG: hypothetical protein ABUK13_09800, partial [Gammaproteobacteria bacterium]